MLDLVSPWTAAVEANDAAGIATFHARHRVLLDQLRLAHAPHARQLPLLTDPAHLRTASAQATNPVFRQHLQELQQRAIALGADAPARLVLLAMANGIDAVTPLPTPSVVAVVMIDNRESAATHFTIALARALAKLTRWSAPDSDSRARTNAAWDPWELARTIPLREWLYAEGLGWHLAQQLHDGIAPRQLFGTGTGAWQRLREQEQVAREQLAMDLDSCGAGRVLRWLVPEAARLIRTPDGTALPPGMGRYLAWRMTAPRVSRIGLAAALRHAA